MLRAVKNLCYKITPLLIVTSQQQQQKRVFLSSLVRPLVKRQRFPCLLYRSSSSSSNTSVKVEWDNFSQQSSERDLGLQVGDSIFWVPRRQLADCSPVFSTMLYGDSKESNTEIVKLTGKEPEEILEMFRCLFSKNGRSDGRKPIDDNNLELLFKLADEYQISSLLDSCSNIFKRKVKNYTVVETIRIIKSEIQENLKGDQEASGRMERGIQRRFKDVQKRTVEETVRFIDIAIRHNLKDVIRACLRRLSGCTPEGLLGNPAFGSLPLSMRYAVSLISSIRFTRPTDHDLEEVECHFSNGLDPRDKEYDDFMSNLCKYRCRRKGVSGYRCTACDYQECGCEENKQVSGSDECYICHHCGKEYCTTDFVCDCVDPLIEAELEKLGL